MAEDNILPWFEPSTCQANLNLHRSNGNLNTSARWAEELKALRIEYTSGRVSQIDLSEVKKITVE
jgi:hypothetical protein